MDVTIAAKSGDAFASFNLPASCTRAIFALFVVLALGAVASRSDCFSSTAASRAAIASRSAGASASGADGAAGFSAAEQLFNTSEKRCLIGFIDKDAIGQFRDIVNALQSRHRIGVEKRENVTRSLMVLRSRRGGALIAWERSGLAA